MSRRVKNSKGRLGQTKHNSQWVKETGRLIQKRTAANKRRNG